MKGSALAAQPSAILAHEAFGSFGVLWGLVHVEVLEGVELPQACGGGIGRPELDPAEGEASLVEQVADVADAEEGPEKVVLLQDGGASALKSGHESVGFSQSVPVYLFCF